MVTQENGALDVLLFGAEDEELLDIKCFRGDRANVTADDIREQIHSGIMQYKLQPSLASARAPETGVVIRDIAELVKGLPIAA